MSETAGLPPLANLPSSEPAPFVDFEGGSVSSSQGRGVDWSWLALSAVAVVLLVLLATGVVSAVTTLAVLAIGWTVVIGTHSSSAA